MMRGPLLVIAPASPWEVGAIHIGTQSRVPVMAQLLAGSLVETYLCHSHFTSDFDIWTVAALSVCRHVEDGKVRKSRMGELVSYRDPYPARRYHSREMGMFLSNHARQLIFGEQLLGELARIRLDNLHELETKKIDYQIKIGRRLLQEMVAHRDNPFLLAGLERQFAKWEVRVDHVLNQVATRRLR